MSLAKISGIRDSSRVCSTASCSPLRSSGMPVTAKTCDSVAGGLLQRLFDLAVRNHFSADLGEAREPIGDRQEPVFIQHGDVAGDVPAIAHGVGREILTSQVAGHDVGTL